MPPLFIHHGDELIRTLFLAKVGQNNLLRVASFERASAVALSSFSRKAYPLYWSRLVGPERLIPAARFSPRKIGAAMQESP